MESNSNQRALLLLLLLLLLLALFLNKDKLGLAAVETTPVSQKQTTNKLKLNDELKAEIAAYFSGVTASANENSIAYATRLDHGTGRKLLIAGKLREAYPVYQKIMKISYDQGSLMGVGISLGTLSNIMHRMGEKDEALKLAFLEYKVSTALGKRFEYGVTQQRIATLMEPQSRSLAMSWRLLARESLEGTPYKENQVNLLINTGRDLEVFDRNEQALAVFEEGYQLTKSLGKSPGERSIKLRLVVDYMRALREAGNYQQSIDMGLEAIESMQEDVRSTRLNYDILYQLGENYRELGEAVKASEHYGAAYRFYEESRVNALGDKARARIDNMSWRLVNRLIDSYINQKDYYQALALLESNKARTLSDIGEDIEQQSIYSQLTQLNRLHIKQRSTFFDHYNTDVADRVDEALQPKAVSQKEKISEYRQLRDEYEQLIDRQQEELVRLKITTQIRDVAISQTISAKQIHGIQRMLSKHQAVISFYARDESVGVFLLTSSGVEFHPSSLSYHGAIREVRKLQAALINPHVELYKSPAKTLAAELIKPLLPKLEQGIESIIYSTDSNFADIPLGVLPVGSEYLVQRYSVTRVPSLKLLDLNVSNKRANAMSGISCVDPDIPYSRLVFQRETGRKLEQLYGNDLSHFMGKDCSAESLEKAIEMAKQPTFLHLGAHGVFYGTRAMNSGLLLSSSSQVEPFNSGDIWDARAIGSVDLSSINLVTIASREAALTDKELRRDLFGLMRTLLFSGVRSVMAPLWAVQDQATSVLMQHFYQAYKEGVAPSQALRHAQLKLLEGKRFIHPYYWSGFVVTEVAQ